MVCRETNTEPIKNFETYSDYGLLSYLNKLLAKNNCTTLEKEELELDLK